MSGTDNEYYFKCLIFDAEAFNLFYLTASDEDLIKFYYFLKRNKKILDYKKSMNEDNSSLDRINELLSVLERCQTIREHNNSLKNASTKSTKKVSALRRIFTGNRK